jgi:hypothetical protein
MRDSRMAASVSEESQDRPITGIRLDTFHHINHAVQSRFRELGKKDPAWLSMDFSISALQDRR